MAARQGRVVAVAVPFRKKTASMTSLSIVIPVLNERENLCQLASHLKERASFAEIIVVDGGSTDGSLEMARGFARTLINSKPGRAVQMNAGAEVSAGQYVLFLHADTRLPEGFEDDFARWAGTCPDWGFSSVRLSGRHWLFRVIEKAISLRTRLTHGASGDQAICVLRERFFSVGAYQDIALMEDIALSRQLSKGRRAKLFARPVLTSSRRWEQRGILKTVFLMWHLRLSYYLGASPESLAALYR